MFVALVGVLSGVFLQYWNGQLQVTLKEYEVTYDAKRHNYAAIMRNVLDAAKYASDGSVASMDNALYKLEPSLLEMEALVRDDFASSTTWRHALEFKKVCRSVASDAVNEKVPDSKIVTSQLEELTEQLRFDLQRGLLGMK